MVLILSFQQVISAPLRLCVVFPQFWQARQAQRVFLFFLDFLLDNYRGLSYTFRQTECAFIVQLCILK